MSIAVALFSASSAAGQPAVGEAAASAHDAEAKISALARTDLTNIADRLGRVETSRPITADGKTGLSVANGVMISPCYMLTNYHVVFGDEKDPRPGDDHSVYFYIGRGTTAFKYRLEGRPIDWGYKRGDGAHDWAIVRLSKCPGRVLGWINPKPVRHEALQSAAITMAVISASSSDGSIETYSCRITDHEKISDLLNHDCPTREGFSGSALLVADSQSGYALVGIDQGITTKGRPRAVSLEEILANAHAAVLLETDRYVFAQGMRAAQANSK